MKFKLVSIFLLLLIFESCYRPDPTYLEAAESVIDSIIENDLVCEGDYFYDELETYFEDYVKKNGYWLEWNEGKENLYYHYLESIRTRGGGLDGANEDPRFLKLYDKVLCAGHVMEHGNYLGAIYSWVKPTIERYETRLIKEKQEGDILFSIAKCDPHETAISSSSMLDGILQTYKVQDFKRPFLKKYVILFWFLNYR